MTTVRDVVEETRSHLMGNNRDRRNRLSAGIDDTTESFPLEFDVQHNAGAVLSVELEDVYVYVPAVGIGSDTVQRGHAGSTPAAHSDGDIVLVNPIFTNWQIFRGINNTLLDLSSRGLFQIKQVPDFNFNPSVYSYSMPADVQFIQSIRVDTPSPTNDWPLIRREDYEFEPNADVDEFATGKMLVLQKGHPGRVVRVTYRTQFTLLPANDWDTNLTTTGLPTTAYDILSLGAAVDVMSGREVKRSFMEKATEPRRSEEVPPGTALQSYRGLMAKYEARIETELSRQMELYPINLY